MRFIQKWAYMSAKYIQMARRQSHEQRATLYFGFQVLYGDVIKFIIIGVLAAIFKSFFVTMVLAFAFVFIRTYAGGVHMKTETKCTIVTLIIFILPGTFISNNQVNLPTLHVLIPITFMASFICLLKYAPKDCTNRPITDKNEKIRLKLKSIVVLCLVISISVIFYSLSYYMLAIAACVGVLLAVFTIIPVGYKLLDMLNKKPKKPIKAV